jgi:hypothetical protein
VTAPDATVAALEQIRVTRYVTPLREGGSLPGIVEGEDLGTYVCKFRGAGQGIRVLVAEVIASGIAEKLGIPTPRLVELDLDAALARYEADEEVQDLLRASVGSNLGMDFLPGAFGFDSTATVDGDLAASIIWFDAFIANVDRSFRNPNLLVWGGHLWAIDHGASLYFHHAWSGGVTDPQRFANLAWSADDHVLREFLHGVSAADARLSPLLDEAALIDIVSVVPDAWLESVPGAETPEELRAAYVRFLTARLGSRVWLPGGAA